MVAILASAALPACNLDGPSTSPVEVTVLDYGPLPAGEVVPPPTVEVNQTGVVVQATFPTSQLGLTISGAYETSHPNRLDVEILVAPANGGAVDLISRIVYRARLRDVAAGQYRMRLIHRLVDPRPHSFLILDTLIVVD